jgi:uncharacterized protein
VKEVIRALVALQKIDNEIHKYAQQKNQLANTLNEMKNLVGKMEQSVEDKQTKLVDVEKWYQEQQDALRDYNDRMAKIKASLNAVTKTKDYLLRQKELESLRRHKQSKEEEIEKVKDTISDFRDAIARDMAKIESLKEETEQEGGATWDQVHQLEETIAEIAKSRTGLLPLVPAKIIRRYEQIKARRDGVAIVEAADGKCLGCHLALRPQHFIVCLRMKSLESCPNCNRYLHVTETSIEEAQVSDQDA